MRFVKLLFFHYIVSNYVLYNFHYCAEIFSFSFICNLVLFINMSTVECILEHYNVRIISDFISSDNFCHSSCNIPKLCYGRKIYFFYPTDALLSSFSRILLILFKFFIWQARNLVLFRSFSLFFFWILLSSFVNFRIPAVLCWCVRWFEWGRPA